MSELSRTQKKKKDRELQKLGERLVTLSDDQLAQIPLTEELSQAVAEAKTIHQHGARRRQMQYIGVLMRSIDPEPVTDALSRLLRGEHENVQRFKRIEGWRDTLISGDDGLLETLLEDHARLDRKTLTDLVRLARKERDGIAKPKSARRLFRYLSSNTAE